MSIEQKYQDMAGKWRVVWSIDVNESIMLKFANNPSDQEVTDKVNTYLNSDNYVYRAVNRLPIIIENFKDVIENAVIFIKTTNPNLTQWNTYLGNLSWYHASVVRWFTFALATGLAAQNNINLSNYTETEVLGKLKVWIIATPGSKIRKIVWGV
jgi:hypothetical protein